MNGVSPPSSLLSLCAYLPCSNLDSEVAEVKRRKGHRYHLEEIPVPKVSLVPVSSPAVIQLQKSKRQAATSPAAPCLPGSAVHLNSPRHCRTRADFLGGVRAPFPPGAIL
ncbi:hypothetical protein C8J56DRAFT_1058086 [Mycena floridula]|nr:hypothetical protein C8J56DRAFT_1058086 [Mycena floridula]